MRLKSILPLSLRPRYSSATTQQRNRCAIYTRKSTEEGLDQEFNSLDAQREAGEAFIFSQKHEGRRLVPESYDDGGFTGGNMERPALKRLMDDIEAGHVDCVIVYKVDRLSRSLLDFTRIMETFDRNGVSFVSVTQQFNTTSSMGRLTLNILLSFAQFEREMISERTRDKMGAARRKGKYTGTRLGEAEGDVEAVVQSRLICLISDCPFCGADNIDRLLISFVFKVVAKAGISLYVKMNTKSQIL